MRGQALREAVVLPAVEEDEALVLVGTEAFGIKVAGAPTLRVLDALRAGTDVSEIEDSLDIGSRELADLLDQLGAAGLLRPTTVHPPVRVPRDEARRVLSDSVVMWKRHSAAHELFALLGDDAPRPDLLVSYLVETAHYVRGAISALRTAVASCRTRDGSRALGQMWLEEEGHDHALFEGVASMGSAGGAIKGSAAAPATKLLVRSLAHLAATDILSYLGCLLFVETHEDAAGSAASLLVLAEANGVPEAAAVPFAAHAAGDGDARHAAEVASILAAELPDEVATSDVDRMLTAIHDLKHAFDLVYDGLVDRWSDSQGAYRYRRDPRFERM